MRNKLWITAFILLIFFAVISTTAFAQPREQNAVYKNSIWRVVLNKDHTLLCYGAGYGNWLPNKSIVIATGVDNFWTDGSWRGPVIVFQKGKVFYATVRQYDSGRDLIAGKIYSGDDVNSINVNGRIYGAYIQIILNNGKRINWSIWQYPGLPGKLEKGEEVMGEPPVTNLPPPAGILPSKPADAKKLLGGELKKVHYFNYDGRWVNLSDVAKGKSKVVICTNNKYGGTAEVLLWLTFNRPAKFTMSEYNFPTKDKNYGEQAKLKFIELDRKDLEKNKNDKDVKPFYNMLKEAPYVYMIKIEAFDHGYMSAYTVNFGAPCTSAAGSAKLDDSAVYRAMIGSW
ncbi:MAG: hypothetical protein ABIH00_03580 [Armatimonadota bacterium]